MGDLSYQLDMSAFTASLKQFVKNSDLGQLIAAQAVGHEVLRLSAFEVPHDVGSLQNSGAVDIIDGDVYVGYHMPYAARLHEHPEYRFQKGRKGKYLEDPIVRNKTALGIVMGENYTEVMKNGK